MKIKLLDCLIIFFILFLIVFLGIVNKAPNTILLSFDTELPDNITIMTNLLNLLNETNSKATFFMLVEFAEKYPEIVNRIINENHEIACHSIHHPRFNELSNQELLLEIQGCKIFFKNKYNIDVKGFRTPYRIINSNVFQILNSSNYTYDASLFHYWNIFYDEPLITEIYTSTCFLFPLDDYIILNFFNFPRETYFKFLKCNKNYLSYSFHPHIVMQYPESFSKFLYSLKTKPITHINYIKN